MIRIRLGLFLTVVLASMCAAVSLLDSLYWFGLWLAVAGVAFIAQDVMGALETRRYERETAKARHPSRWTA